MTAARKFFSELAEATLDGTELYIVEINGKKYKVTGGGGGLSLVIDTAAGPFTAVAGEFHLVDLANANKTLNLPASMVAKDQVGLMVVDSTNGISSSNLLTLGRNGKTIKYGGSINGRAGGTADDWTFKAGQKVVVSAFDTNVWEVTD